MVELKWCWLSRRWMCPLLMVSYVCQETCGKTSGDEEEGTLEALGLSSLGCDLSVMAAWLVHFHFPGKPLFVPGRTFHKLRAWEPVRLGLTGCCGQE